MPETGSTDYTSLIKLTVGFALTLLATQIWMRIQKVFIKENHHV